MWAKLQEIRQQLRTRMHEAVRNVGRWLGAVVRGWFNYHAVPGNSKCLNAFCTDVQRLWRHVLRRRSQKGRRWNWKRVRRLVRRWLPRPQILHPYPDQRLIIHHSRQEPYEVALHVRICAGGRPQGRSLPRPHTHQVKE
jgi:hypothetical protein